MPIIKNKETKQQQKITSVDVVKLELLCTVGGNVK